MTKQERAQIKTDREAWSASPQENTSRLYEQVYQGLKDMGHHGSAVIVRNAIADLLKAYPQKS